MTRLDEAGSHPKPCIQRSSFRAYGGQVLEFRVYTWRRKAHPCLTIILLYDKRDPGSARAHVPLTAFPSKRKLQKRSKHCYRGLNTEKKGVGAPYTLSKIRNPQNSGGDY